MPRSQLDLHQKVRDVLQHTVPLPPESSSPLVNYERTVGACLGLIKYIDDHLRATSIYEAVYNRHMALQRRLALAHLIEAFERFLKELAVVCVDHLAPAVYDDRFEGFSPSGTELASHFEAGSIGNAMCESDTWISNRVINGKFRRLLQLPHGELWDEHLFPSEKQGPPANREQAETLSILWQVRHTITHNVGILTGADAAKLRFLAKRMVSSGQLLAPTKDDIRYVKRFLHETATETSRRIGKRLETVLSELHAGDPMLFDAAEKANAVSRQFRLPLTINGKTGVL